MPFCNPVQRPAASGPASVCVMAQWLDEKSPNAMYAAISKAMETRRSGARTAGNMSVASTIPLTTKLLRTVVADAPRVIQRSDAQPPSSDALALAANGSDASTAIIFIERPRSETRYDGSQVSKK